VEVKAAEEEAFDSSRCLWKEAVGLLGGRSLELELAHTDAEGAPCCYLYVRQQTPQPARRKRADSAPPLLAMATAKQRISTRRASVAGGVSPHGAGLEVDPNIEPAFNSKEWDTWAMIHLPPHEAAARIAEKGAAMKSVVPHLSKTGGRRGAQTRMQRSDSHSSVESFSEGEDSPVASISEDEMTISSTPNVRRKVRGGRRGSVVQETDLIVASLSKNWLKIKAATKKVAAETKVAATVATSNVVGENYLPGILYFVQAVQDSMPATDGAGTGAPPLLQFQRGDVLAVTQEHPTDPSTGWLAGLKVERLAEGALPDVGWFSKHHVKSAQLQLEGQPSIKPTYSAATYSQAYGAPAPQLEEAEDGAPVAVEDVALAVEDDPDMVAGALAPRPASGAGGDQQAKGCCSSRPVLRAPAAAVAAAPAPVRRPITPPPSPRSVGAAQEPPVVPERMTLAQLNAAMETAKRSITPVSSSVVVVARPVCRAQAVLAAVCCLSFVQPCLFAVAGLR
jgi:hypothetical protein